MQSMKRLAGQLLVAVIFYMTGAGMLAAAPTTESIEASIQRAMAEFDAPGMAVSIVHDGKLFYSDGHGIVEIGSSERVDDRTLFQIGSVSKAFTAATLAILADEGKLDWDDPVIDHLAEFRMHDAWVTREFTIRDLLTHRSGLPIGAGDLLMFPDGNAGRGDVIRALRYLEPASSFRSQFAYDNLLYIVAGEVVARVANMPFEAFLEQRLLAPLGMRDCVASPDRAGPRAALATPHVVVDGELETTTTRVTGLVAAAGGIACSARSMANWMSFLLNEGMTSDGERLISNEQFRQLTTPVTLLAAPGYLVEHAGTSLNAYALGWGVSTFYGQPMLSHGGGVWGMTTFIALLPEHGLAVFATNNQMSAAPRAIVNDLIDRFLRDAVPDAGKDWIAILSETSQERQAAAAEAVAAAWESRKADSTPSLPLYEYAGTYRDEWYGDVRISLTGDGQLWFRSTRNEPLHGPLEHFQYDTFIARWTDRRLMADAYVTFSLIHDGAIERIRMKAVSPATDFSYDFHDLNLRRVASDR
jgi:CubicO group peptidase (beta-lactamase class C family)